MTPPTIKHIENNTGTALHSCLNNAVSDFVALRIEYSSKVL